MSSNNRLYLYEYTPSSWNFVGSIKTYNPRDLNRTQLSTLAVTAFAGTDRFPQAYKCDMPDLGTAVYFDIDDTELHREGVYSIGEENDPYYDGNGNAIDYSHQDIVVKAQYAYLTGVASWTGHMPWQHREWVFGHQPDNVVLGAPHTTTTRTGRVVTIPPDEYTVAPLAAALDDALIT